VIRIVFMSTTDAFELFAFTISPINLAALATSL